MNFYRKFGKRALDVLLSAAGLIVLSPLLAAISLAVALESKGPVFFAQKRVGKDGRLFSLYKFRSMRQDAPHDMPTHLLQNADGFITRTGKFLRRTSLDELPQLMNILLGQMSVVGPRPALWNQDDLIALRRQNGAAAIRPGLTGLAQVSGRDELEISEKARIDGVYAEKYSFLFDMKCVLLTVRSVVRHEGVVEGGTGTKNKPE